MKNGFTLVEILLVVVTSSIVGTLLIQTLIQNNGVFYQQSGRVSEGLSLNNATSIITKDIRSSQGVALGYPQPSPYQYVSSDNTLVLSVPSIDSSGNVISQTYDYIIIFADSINPNVLRKKVYPALGSIRGQENRVLLSNLSQVKFSYFDANGQPVSPQATQKINFILNASTQIGEESQVSSSSSEVNLRND